MSGSTVAARCTDSRIIGRHRCGPDAFLLDVEVDHELPALRPGVFAMLSPANGTGPELGRPFSLYDQRGRTLRFLIQVMGVGTKALERLEIGELVTLTAIEAPVLQEFEPDFGVSTVNMLSLS